MSSLIIAHDLYQSAVKIKKRDYHALDSMKKLSISFIIAIFSSGLQNLTSLIREEWWRLLMNDVWPLNSFLSFIIMALMFYCGLCILSALRKSDTFRQTAAMGRDAIMKASNKYRHLIFIVYVLILAQSLRLVLRIVQTVMWSLSMDNFASCKSKLPGELSQEVIPCFSKIKWSKYVHVDYCNLFEISCILCISVHNKCSIWQ